MKSSQANERIGATRPCRFNPPYVLSVEGGCRGDASNAGTEMTDQLRTNLNWTLQLRRLPESVLEPSMMHTSTVAW